MYAIFQDGGRQYKVSAGDKIYVDIRDLAEGQQTIEFDQVLALGEGENSRIGQPLIDGELKAKKIDVVKYRRRKNYRRKQGHRQKHLQVTISEIVG